MARTIDGKTDRDAGRLESETKEVVKLGNRLGNGGGHGQEQLEYI